MFRFNPEYSSRFRILKGGKISLVVSAFLTTVSLFGSPTGGTVTSGTANIAQSGTTTNITQSTQKATINWNKFSIAGNETVNFNQPNANSITLNRVIGGEKSIIDGALNANGQVWILNSNGVLFNSTARINTAGILATTKNISDTDFNNGNYKFTGDSIESVVNMGEITISNSGYAALLATNVSNEGTIKAVQGTIALVGADAYTININGNSLVDIQIDKGVIDSLVENKGLVIADGGKIIMTSKAADEILKNVVNNSGIVEAKSFDDMFGEVEIIAEGGHAENSGTIDVSSDSGKGGTATVTGYHTLVTETGTINADGKTGGGTVQVGGSFQNSDTSVYQAVGTIVQEGAKLTANATDNGDGGTVVAWSDVLNDESVTRAYGNFEAKGGVNGGDGGRIEQSGHWIDVDISKSNVLAPKGTAGNILYDPYNVIISDLATSGMTSFGTLYSPLQSDSVMNASSLATLLNGGNNVTVSSYYYGDGTKYPSSGTDYGNIFVNANITYSSGKLTLEAAANVYIVDNKIIGAGQTGTSGLEINAVSGIVGTVGGIYSYERETGYHNGSISVGSGGIKIREGYSGDYRNPSSPDYRSTTLPQIRTLGDFEFNTYQTSNFTNYVRVDGNFKHTNYAGNRPVTFSSGSSTIGNIQLQYSTDKIILNSYGGSLYSKGLNGTQGTIEVSSGTIFFIQGNSDFTGTLTNNGTIALQSGTHKFNAPGGSGTFNIGSATFKPAQTMTLSNFISGSGNLDLSLGGLTVNANQDISFSSISGSNALTVNNAYQTTFGTVSNISSLTTNSGGTTYIGGNITTTGAQTYNDAVTVGNAFTLTGSSFYFGGNLTSNYALTLAGNSSGLTVSGAVNIGSNALTLKGTSSGSGAFTINQTITAGSLLLQDIGTANLTNTLKFSGVTTLAASGVGSLNYLSSGALSIGTVGGVNGISATGTIEVATNSGDLTLAQNIATTNTTASAIILNAGKTAAAGTSTGGNIVRTGGTITVGTNGTAKLYTGSITGSTGLSGYTALSSGSGRFRYNSDEISSGYTKALATGLNVIYREQPTLGVTVSSASKTYDGDVYSGTPTVSYTFKNGDTAGADITIGTFTFNGDGATAVNAGSYSMGAELSGFANTLGYANPTSATEGTLTINKRALSLSGTKVYDSTTNIEASKLTTFTNLVGSETVTLSGAGTVANKNVANGKAVTVTGLTLADGENGGLGANYTLTGGTYTVDITKADISVSGITAVTKEYDATTTATLDKTTAVTFNGILGSDVLSVATATGTFSNKNVATGKTVSITGLTLGSTDAGNYNLVDDTASTTANITAKDLTLSGVVVANKVYDRTTTGTISNNGTLAGIIGADTVTLDSTSATATFADWNVANGKTVTLGGLTLSGTDALNYTFSLSAPVTANITPKSLGLELTGTATRVYDSTTSLGFSGYTVSPTGVTSGDTVVADTGSITGFIDKNVGTDKQVTFTGFNISGADAGNYQLVSGSAVTNASITKATISSVTGITAATKVYDATTAATLTTTGAAFTGKLGTDVLSVASATGTFSDKNAGTGKTVNISGITLNGTDAGNYTLADATASTTADITQKALTVTYTGVNKTYDALTDATVTTSDDRLGSDVLTIGRTASFADKTAANGKTINVTGVSLSGTDALNYSVTTTGSTTANILKKDVTLTGLAVNDKVYDGSATATFSDTGTLVDYISGDDVAVNVAGMSAAFGDKNVGTAKSVTLSGVALTGVDKDNYNFTSPTGATADITVKTLVVAYTGVDKVYDSTTVATVTTSDDRVGGDILTIARTATFSDKNVGNGKTVSVSGVSLSGDDALNYSVTTTGSTTANITKANISAVTGITAQNKVYDTTDAATLVTSGAAFTDMFAGDVLNVATSSGTFSDKNAADGKTVSISGITLDGTDAGNYNLVSDIASTTANISKATITAIGGITANNKVYDATTTATLNTGAATFTGKLGSDDLSVTASTASFADKNVANAKTVTVDTITFGGTDAGNYAISSSLSTLTADITPASISAITGITAENKVYDRTTNATLDTSVASFTGKIGSDVLSVATSTGTFASDWNVGAGKNVNITGLTLGGVDANNYTLANATASTTADITKKQVTLDLAGAGTKVYDGTTTLSLNGITPSLLGIIEGDTVDIATGSVTGFVDKNVGTNKSVTFTGFALSNTDAGNYDIGSGTAPSTASITRLDSVIWTGGGSTTSWFDAANWAGGAVPDLSNVANVVIPTGVTVSFDTAGASTGVSITAVNVDSLGTLGSMAMTNGALNVANGVTLSSFTQSGGALAASTLSVTDNFSQTNTAGTIAISGNANITQTTGNAQLGNIATGGTLGVVASNGNIVQLAGGAIVPTGLATISASGDITLNGTGNNFSTLALSGVNVAFNDSVGGVALGNITTTGTFGATSTGGNIAQATGATLSVAGIATLDAGTDSIALSNTANDFQSSVNAHATNVALTDANGLELGNVATTGTLTATAVGNVSQTTGTALSIGGNTALTSTTGDVTLDSATNNFTGSFGASGNSVALTNYAHAITLGNIVSNTALNIVTTGAITQAVGSTLTSNVVASLDAGTSDVTLSNAGNDFNTLTLAGNNLAFSDSIGGVTLGNIATAGTFSATSTGGNIAQVTGTTLALTGDASFNSGTYNTVLTNAGNNFTTLALAGKDVSFKDSVGTTTLGNIATTGAFSATNTVGAITQAGGTSMAIAGLATFDEGSQDFALSNAGNNFGSLGVTANNVAITNMTAPLTLANMNVAGTLGLNIAGNILQTAGTTINVVGATTLASTTGNIALDSATNDFQSTVNASGVNVALKDANGIELGAITSTGNFAVTAANDVTQAIGTSLAIGGNAVLASTAGDVTLGEAGNNFTGSFGASGNSVSLTNYAHPLALGNIVSNTALNIVTTGAITQATGSKLTLKGTSSLDAGTSSINLGNKGNDYTTLTLTGSTVTKAETVQEEATRLKEESLASSNILNSSSITNTIVKDVQNIEKNFQASKGNNEIFNNLLQPQTARPQGETQTLTQQTQTISILQPIAQTFNLAEGETLSIASISTQENEMQKVSYGELLEMQAKATQQEVPTDQNEEEIVQVATEFKIPVAQNSLVVLVDGGINLPDGIDQEFYIVKDELIGAKK